tara:strand:+ start:704 stop:910 length:207 start_codon:yes stop_codon:yes gene_type:complete
MIKNLFLFVSLFGIGYLSTLSISQGLNKSTLNQCINNNDNKACNYLVNNGSSNFQKQQAAKTLLIRGL